MAVCFLSCFAAAAAALLVFIVFVVLVVARLLRWLFVGVVVLVRSGFGLCFGLGLSPV